MHVFVEAEVDYCAWLSWRRGGLGYITWLKNWRIIVHALAREEAGYDTSHSWGRS